MKANRVCETCDNWSRDRMRCDHAPEEPCPPECTCDGWTAAPACDCGGFPHGKHCAAVVAGVAEHTPTTPNGD